MKIHAIGISYLKYALKILNKKLKGQVCILKDFENASSTLNNLCHSS